MIHAGLYALPSDLSQEPQTSLFLQSPECRLPACHPAPRRCCYPAVQGGRCIHLHAAAQRTCACTVPGKEASQSGQGPCREEKAKGHLKLTLILKNPSYISRATCTNSKGTPELVVAWQEEQESSTQVQSTVKH